MIKRAKFHDCTLNSFGEVETDRHADTYTNMRFIYLTPLSPSPARPPISNIGVKNIGSTGHLGKQKQKNSVFLLIHNPCTRNGDHLILLINIGNAPKQRMFLKTLIYIIKKW